MIPKQATRKAQTYRRPIKENKKLYLEDDDSISFNYDDDISFNGYGVYDSENDYEDIYTSPKKEVEQSISKTRKPVTGKLEEIEERLAKIERMLQQLLSRNQLSNIPSPDNSSISLPSTITNVTDINTAPTQMLESKMPTSPKGSMLSEIQSVIAQQGGIGENIYSTLGMENNDVSSIATMSASSYDDDIPIVNGID